MNYNTSDILTINHSNIFSTYNTYNSCGYFQEPYTTYTHYGNYSYLSNSFTTIDTFNYTDDGYDPERCNRTYTQYYGKDIIESENFDFDLMAHIYKKNNPEKISEINGFVKSNYFSCPKDWATIRDNLFYDRKGWVFARVENPYSWEGAIVGIGRKDGDKVIFFDEKRFKQFGKENDELFKYDSSELSYNSFSIN